jgi:hypothetical protein
VCYEILNKATLIHQYYKTGQKTNYLSINNTKHKIYELSTFSVNMEKVPFGSINKN